MPVPSHETTNCTSQRAGYSVLELSVNNHPQVMSHVCGLFSRRAYQVEGMLWLPGRGKQSRVWLLVNDEQPLDQMIKQMAKLEDVRAVRSLGADGQVFVRLEEIFCPNAMDSGKKRLRQKCVTIT
ncbi:MAG: acetolactate synthase isozyme 1 small subunit [Desulfomonile tiedjei]|uniref:Acetolactate synthase isozyme 1 small subunit n=1 Tax=Desulfomonile tiedjei TaxID=2358 RepID=A0A9D6V4S8_9BACT|nr:acetolactate synthase isozyme 1 small subunit [Desulfomonile tiedjei]